MIVPRYKTLLGVALLVIPFTIVAALVPSSSAFCWTGIGLVGCVMLLDMLLVQNRLSGIAVSFPKIARLSRDQEGQLAFHLSSPDQTFKDLRLGLPLSSDFSSPQEELRLAVPAREKQYRVCWPCTPHQRGKYIMHHCYLGCNSPLGFWFKRQAVPTRAEIRVYPNMRAERRQAAAWFLPSGGLGIKRLHQVGKGREFEKLREYIPGDAYEDIHWKATAKRGYPITKTYQVERTQEVYVIIDASRLSAREAGPSLEGARAGAMESQLDRYIASALILCQAAEQQGDAFGLLAFDQKVQAFLKANRGKVHFDACRDGLYTLKTERVNPDFEALCTFIRTRIRKRALLIFLTSLDDPVLSETFIRGVDVICKQHLVVVNMMRPRGAHPLFSQDEVVEIDALYRQLGGHMTWHKLQELKKMLARRGVHFDQLEQASMTPSLISQYVAIKEKQLI